ncbi:lactate/malate family dehydrogenase [Alkalilimnicola sp. S0819]|uniref:lactate/malate family dehydrogenase n=1 Tax=Alkalilimnicola sp. S0819 TaxID=2613922 RepID=UPI001261E23D|nr:L-lactate dehydrogenase [Alkalilimnicola sp. S0819]KAB7624090.1 L-lactate dehydrogenase [Alkalilimnicola sp. S0819]MPQ16340.1 L-lactate dehydrogenase [Alkalilimnicola sp. S0819]
MARVGIIGLGWVGASVAAAVLQRGLAQELLLHDVRGEIAEGEALDFAHGALLYPRARVRAAPLSDFTTLDAVVVSAGRGGKPDESRLALLRDNLAVAESLGQALRGFAGVIIAVSNPVDIFTEVLRRAAELPAERVIGTGTTLDSARLRFELGEQLGVHPHSVHAQVLGEHGDSELVNWSAAQAGGRTLRDWRGWNEELEAEIAARVRGAAYEIIRRKGATNQAIGLVTASVLAAVLHNEDRVLTVSRLQQGVAGVDGVPLSLPAVVGRDGATRVLEPRLDAAEAEALARSAAIIAERLPS